MDKTYGEELKRIGWLCDEEVGARKMHAYLEYHLEQGPILEAEEKTIGVVTHCQGLWWLEFTLTGKEAHTGSTPMNMRVNAGLAMARILEMVQKGAMDAQPVAVGGLCHARSYVHLRRRGPAGQRVGPACRGTGTRGPAPPPRAAARAARPARSVAGVVEP